MGGEGWVGNRLGEILGNERKGMGPKSDYFRWLFLLTVPRTTRLTSRVGEHLKPYSCFEPLFSEIFPVFCIICQVDSISVSWGRFPNNFQHHYYRVINKVGQLSHRPTLIQLSNIEASFEVWKSFKHSHEFSFAMNA